MVRPIVRCRKVNERLSILPFSGNLTYNLLASRLIFCGRNIGRLFTHNIPISTRRRSVPPPLCRRKTRITHKQPVLLCHSALFPLVRTSLLPHGREPATFCRLGSAHKRTSQSTIHSKQKPDHVDRFLFGVCLHATHQPIPWNKTVPM